MANEKLDWIYKGVSGLVDREDYLIGRKIDKTFQLLELQEKGQKGDLDVDVDLSVPPSIFDSNDAGTIDLINKMREDPLYEMKKKQAEENKKILQNPIKMKRIKAMLETTFEGNETSKRKKKKKHHKSKRDSSSSDDNRKSRRKNREKRSTSSSSKNSSPERRRSRSKIRKKSHNHHFKQYKEPSFSYSYHTQSPIHSHSHCHYKFKRKHQKSTKRLTSEELEKKRQEMLEAGSWREKQRKINVEHYKKEEQKNKDGYFLGNIIKT